MLKQVHKIFIYLCLFCFLISPSVCISAEQSEAEIMQKEQMELVHKDIKVNDTDIEPMDTRSVKKYVVPDTKQEGRKVIGWFIKVMIGVMFSAVILYVILLFVKKYYGSAFISNTESNDNDEEYESLDLSTPNNRQDALKSFLNRTK